MCVRVCVRATSLPSTKVFPMLLRLIQKSELILVFFYVTHQQKAMQNYEVES